MTTLTQDEPSRGGWLPLGAFLGLCFIVSGIGGAITGGSVDTWYQTLAKPAFTPPDWVFPPVWTALYVLIAIAGWLAWRRVGFAGQPAAMLLYGLQLALNLLWSVLFFGLQRPGLALIEIVVLWGVIAATVAAFWPIDRRAAWLMVPYLLWVGYAGVLNGAIWWLN